MGRMRIKIAEHAGFCFGVKEALRKTEEVLAAQKEKPVRIYTCGSLIHNRIVTGELEEKGISAIDRPEDAEPGSIIIVRSHGEPESFYRKAEQQGLTVVDATCPFVSKIHYVVREAALNGRNIVVVGDANHPEVIGTTGWAGENCRVIGQCGDGWKNRF